MPPSPIYKVKFGTQFLPGFVQTEDGPLVLNVANQTILNRNGGILSHHGAQARRIILQFIVMSRLGAGYTELQHLNDCKDQAADSAAILTSALTPEKLYIGSMDKYVLALPTSIGAPLAAGTPRTLRFTVEFIAEPYWRADTPVSDSFTGNGTLTMTLPETRETYPVFSIPSGVTAFVATHAASGRSVDFLRGTVTGAVRVDCGDFSVVNTSSGADRSRTMQNVNFGIRHTTGAGDFELDITGFAGSGTVDVDVRPRYEWND